MREVKLYGHLGKRFGKSFMMDVANPAEAMRALKANLPGFEQYLTKNSAPGYHVCIEKRSLGVDDLTMPCGRGTIKIIPAVAGAKRNGAFQAIIGVALVVVGVLFAQPALIKIGASMAISGVITMLTAPPPRTTSERPENMPSYSFNGPVNTTTQGNPVPVCYGEMVVGSQVASFGLIVEDVWAPGSTDGTGGTGGVGGGLDVNVNTTIIKIEKSGEGTTWNYETNTPIFYSIFPANLITSALRHNYTYDITLTQGGNTLAMYEIAYDRYSMNFVVSGEDYPLMDVFTSGAALVVTGGRNPAWSDGGNGSGGTGGGGGVVP